MNEKKYEFIVNIFIELVQFKIAELANFQFSEKEKNTVLLVVTCSNIILHGHMLL